MAIDPVRIWISGEHTEQKKGPVNEILKQYRGMGAALESAWDDAIKNERIVKLDL